MKKKNKVLKLKIFEIEKGVEIKEKKKKMVEMINKGKEIKLKKKMCKGCNKIKKYKEWME
jgi:hypothetical protein